MELFTDSEVRIVEQGQITKSLLDLIGNMCTNRLPPQQLRTRVIVGLRAFTKEDADVFQRFTT